MSEAEGTASTLLVDPGRLTTWAEEHLPGTGPVEVERHAAGHSNLTFVVRREGSGPSGSCAARPKARCCRRRTTCCASTACSTCSAAAAVRVPTVTAACDDPTVIGVPFYLMERVDGIVIRETPPEWLADDDRDAARRHALGLDLADALAELHTAPYEPLVAAGIGKPDGYLRRQLRRWRGQREGVQQAAAAAGAPARELPDYDALRDWLEATVPAEVPPAIVHGDYKLDNVIVTGAAAPGADAAPRVAAIVDWEMATVGDPRADLGYFLSFWVNEGERMPWHELVTSAPGYASRDEMVARWEQGTDRIAGDITWFVTLAVWKLAVLLEASYHRHLAGTTDDPFFALLEQGVPALLARARELAGA